jgi:peptidoglycan/LPS O-acetylase OafA/YrhL
MVTVAYRPFGAFRFLLAAMVLAQHSLVLLPPAGREVFYNLELGAVAVAVFFALSGFIVAEALASFYAQRPGAFIVNRCLRVIPPYLAAFALAVALDSWLYGRGELQPLDAPLIGPPWALPTLLAGAVEFVPGLPAHRLSGQDFSFIPFVWTLRVEFAFYATACAFVLAHAWIGTAARRRIQAAAFVTFYLSFATFLLLRHHAGARELLNAPFFAFGIVSFLRLRGHAESLRAHWLAITAIVPIAFVLCGERGHPVWLWQLPLLAALFTGFLVLSRLQLPPGWWRQWDKRLGGLSYPLYIGHGIVLTLLASISARRGALPYLAAVGLSLALAVVLHTIVEAPLGAVRDRVRGRKV